MRRLLTNECDRVLISRVHLCRFEYAAGLGGQLSTAEKTTSSVEGDEAATWLEAEARSTWQVAFVERVKQSKTKQNAIDKCGVLTSQ